MTERTTTGWTITQRRDRAALARGIAAALARLARDDECPPARRGLLWRHSRDIGELADRMDGHGINADDDPAAADGWARELTGLGPQAAALGRELAGVTVQLACFYGPADDDTAGAGNPPDQG